jgi:hypothetical protein
MNTQQMLILRYAPKYIDCKLHDKLITLKYGYHLGLLLVLSGVSLDGALTMSCLSSPLAYKTSMKCICIVSIDLL